jgi:hypothetical protein
LELNAIDELNVDVLVGAATPNTGDWYNSAFQGEQGQTAKTTLTDADKAAGPTGEGWVFQLLGYTFKKNGRKLVMDTLLKNLQSDRMRSRGLTHACLIWYSHDEKWTPKKVSAYAARSRISETLKTGSGTSNYGQGQGLGSGNFGRNMGSGEEGMNGKFGNNGMMGAGLGGGVAPNGGMGNAPPAGMGGSGKGGRYPGLMGAGGGNERMQEEMYRGMRGGMGMGMGSDSSVEDEMPFELGAGSGDKTPEKSIERTDFEIQIVWSPAKMRDPGTAPAAK